MRFHRVYVHSDFPDVTVNFKDKSVLCSSLLFHDTINKQNYPTQLSTKRRHDVHKLLQ